MPAGGSVGMTRIVDCVEKNGQPLVLWPVWLRICDVYTEAKRNGYDVKALRTISQMRKQDTSITANT